MNKKLFALACLITLIAIILNFQIVFAHETLTVGDYEIVYGWVNEPPIAGQLNGVEIFVNNTGGEGQPVEEHIIHTLVVELSYGGESKTLTLDPVFDTLGAFDATILPTIPGVYSLKFSGTLGDTPVDEEVQLEEVQAADAVQFPRAASITYPNQETSAGTADWLVWLSLLLGLAGVVLGAIALRKSG
ncbi:MAG TPA: hypothetical protein VFH34_02785 [Anaerolineales bacterium]|nr:hypothetical protein [Anaerolineales bacterium]